MPVGVGRGRVSDQGGDPPCWAHLVDELDTHGPCDPSMWIDLCDTGGDGNGAIWSLPHGGDLDANLIRLEGGRTIDQHVNVEVDVLIVVWGGAGELFVDERPQALRQGIVVLIPRGRSRAIRAGADGIVYLSIHRHRGPLVIGRRK